LQAALALKKKAKGCVMYYGMPEKDLAKLKQLKCDVVFIHAQKDKWINDEVVADFEANMKSARKKLNVFRYDADHAFANPSSPRYHEASAKASRDVSRVFLSKK
jgi:carboxymethylenebutenolidase